MVVRVNVEEMEEAVGIKHVHVVEDAEIEEVEVEVHSGMSALEWMVVATILVVLFAVCWYAWPLVLVYLVVKATKKEG